MWSLSEGPIPEFT